MKPLSLVYISRLRESAFESLVRIHSHEKEASRSREKGLFAQAAEQHAELFLLFGLTLTGMLISLGALVIFQVLLD